LHEQARCKACGELVTAKEVAAVGAGDGRWQDCPHCGATGKKARISWLLGQYPKYQNANGFETHRRIYNAPAAADALAAPWNADELGPILILAQGFTDAWALHEAGYGAVITAFGSAPNLRQLGMIERLAARTSCLVMVTADDTEGGRDLARRTVAGLQAQGLIAFSLTDYEEGAKNAAEFLRRYGARALARLIRDERLWNTHKAQTRRHPRRRAVAIAESELQGPADPRPKMPALDFPGGLGMLVP
jgi:DNA primase